MKFQNPKYKKRSFSTLIIVVIAIIVLFIGGYVLFPKFLKSNDSSKNGSNNQESITSDSSFSEIDNNSEQTTTANTNDEIKEETKTKILDEAKKYADENDYKSAISVIKDAQSNYGDDTDYIKALNSYSAAYKTEAINESEELANNGDYHGALQKMADAIAVIGDSDQKLLSKKQEYETKYVETTVAKADSLANDEKYDEALNLLSDAQKNAPESNQLKTKYDEIIAKKPQYLVNVLQPYESNDYEEFSNGKFVMMGGSEHYNGFTLNVYGWNGQSCAIYNLNGKYKSITGLTGYVDGQTGDRKTWNITIIADGTVVYSRKVSPGELPQEFSLDLTNVVKLEFRTGETNGFQGVIGFADIEIIGGTSSGNPPQTVEASDTNITHLVDVIQPFDSNDYEMFNGVNSVMMGGIERFNGFTLNVYGWNGQSCAIYNLNGKYKKLTGIIGYVDGRTGDGKTWDTYIFADDKPIFECAVKPGDLPYEFDVDLTGVTKLEFRTGETNGFSGIIGFAELDIK